MVAAEVVYGATRVSRDELAGLFGDPINADREVGRFNPPAGLRSLGWLRRNLNDAMSESHVTGASLDDWEQTVAEQGAPAEIGRPCSC